MIREIVKINEEKCNGCGVCIPNCHEGALQIIDGKARLVSELMCDGLGACIGHCPESAITIEKREAEPYDELETIKEMVPKGLNTIVAHLVHLNEHNETAYFNEAMRYLEQRQHDLPFSFNVMMSQVHDRIHNNGGSGACAGGCPGSKPVDLSNIVIEDTTHSNKNIKSALGQWPVQLHLINPAARSFQNANLLLAADCVAFTMGDFHPKHLQGNALAIACPKLDSGKEIYIEKIRKMIDDANINTITVMMMEVPCCHSLLQLVQMALSKAKRKVPVKMMVVNIKGEVIKDEWL
ncbi:MAG: 4Fe-4S binding protein [Bacteroidales bacterium]|nr:4Fe-4S binding protein [Bacteroidales bacterium]